MSVWLYDGVGLLGVFLSLLAFVLLQHGSMHPRDLRYSLMNFFGSLCIIFSLIWQWNLASFLIEVSWALISLYGVFLVLSQRNASLK